MATPRPWSFTSLDCFVTCPRQYHEKYVLKSVPYVETEAQAEGTRAHKAFEDRLGTGVPLPAKYAEHEPYMRAIEARGGAITTERKVALNRSLEPCAYFAKDVWWRGVIDVHQRCDDNTHYISDYKTGRKKPKPRQLQEFAIYAIASGAEVVQAEFYWTQDKTRTPLTFPASHFGHLLQSHVPDLKLYVDAYKYDQWLPKHNPLCRNYCEVVGCEFHGRAMGQ